jgi:hypothetical protein
MKKKRINIQRDVDSRQLISNHPVVYYSSEKENETSQEIMPEDAESKIVQERAADESPEPEKKTKKRGRASTGDV